MSIPIESGAGASRWRNALLVIKVVELRLRFVSLMAATGLVFAYWDELANRYEKWARRADAHQVAATGVEHFCPMHPQVVQDDAGSCPICGMGLTRRKKGERQTLPAGVTARVELGPSRVAQAGVRTTEVSYASLARTVNTVGSVVFDERRLANITSKVPGRTRVEKLHVNYTGQTVEVGQTLAELYSPELAQAAEELLSAARRIGPRGQSGSGVARALESDRQAMLRASAEKLGRWGVTPSQVETMLKKGKVEATIPVLSPIDGHVFRKNVVEGQEVAEGYAMFEVADLRTVWVQAQVHEQDLNSVREGQPVEAGVEAFPGQTFPGKVEFIQPLLDPTTRTVEVRFALDNPGLRLRPGMFAAVTLTAPTNSSSLARKTPDSCPVTNLKLGSMGQPVSVTVEGRNILTCCAACGPKLQAEPARYLARLKPAPVGGVLSVPESAVIDTGRRQVVYVESEPGVFEGRAVVLGPRVGDRFPVLEGLAPGERVVSDGAFLIDAESRINPGASPAPAPVEARPEHVHSADASSGDVRRR